MLLVDLAAGCSAPAGCSAEDGEVMRSSRLSVSADAVTTAAHDVLAAATGWHLQPTPLSLSALARD